MDPALKDDPTKRIISLANFAMNLSLEDFAVAQALLGSAMLHLTMKHLPGAIGMRIAAKTMHKAADSWEVLSKSME